MSRTARLHNGTVIAISNRTANKVWIRLSFRRYSRFRLPSGVCYFRPTGTIKKIITALSARFRCGKCAGCHPGNSILACWFVRYLTWRKVGWKTAKENTDSNWRGINEDYFTTARIAIEIFNLIYASIFASMTHMNFFRNARSVAT